MRGPRLLLVLLLLTAFTLTALDARSGDGSPFEALRRGVDTVLGPAQRTLGGAVTRIAGAFDGESEADERLQEENARLQAELRRTDDLRRRVRELDELLRLRDYGSYPMVPARVSAKGSAFGFQSTVTIDAGSSDGIEPGQTVVDGDGLLGRTVRVGPFTATVLLLTDPGFTVGARLDRQGTVGLATGTGNGLELVLVEGGRLQEGDALLTTGSDTFVPGVPVGRVTSVDNGRLVSTAQVDPFVDVTALDLVGVVTEPPRSTPRVPLQPSPRP
ncbi:MAG: rod shape-determining protein MreC [Actinomycetota bacterium]|nr:rod shape-determining protein MreC [Actinomycetota bacterium]